MNVLILGGNAAAHFMAKIFTQNTKVDNVYHYIAYNGIQEGYKYIPITSVHQLYKLIISDHLKFDLAFSTTIDTMMDTKIQNLLKTYGVKIAYPNIKNCQLEWSKFTSKNYLRSLGIPTPESRIISQKDLFQSFFDIPRPFVLKYERDWRVGLQTLIITDENYVEEWKSLNDTGQLRYSNSNVGEFENQHFVLEEFIKIKREYSYHAIFGKHNWEYLGTSRDYKKWQEGDVGFNTAGMGCYSPVKDIHPDINNYVDKIWLNLKTLQQNYNGVIYLGIAEDMSGNPYILEINTRQGDPEFQSILLTFKEPEKFLDMLIDVVKENVLSPVEFGDQSAVVVRIVNKNYRHMVETTAKKGIIEPAINPYLWPEPPNFHISYNNKRTILNCTIATTGNSIDNASDKIYKFLDGINMFDFVYRKDIGYLK